MFFQKLISSCFSVGTTNTADTRRGTTTTATTTATSSSSNSNRRKTLLIRFSSLAKMGLIIVCCMRIYSLYRIHLNDMLLSAYSSSSFSSSDTIIFLQYPDTDQEELNEKGGGSDTKVPSGTDSRGVNETEVFHDIVTRIHKRDKVCGGGGIVANDTVLRMDHVGFLSHGSETTHPPNNGGNKCQLPPERLCPVVAGFTTIVTYHHSSFSVLTPHGGTKGSADDTSDKDTPMIGKTKVSGQDALPGSHRILFMNLLSLLGQLEAMKRSNAASKSNEGPDIILFYHGGSLEDLKNDRAYGKRIWNWHEQGILHLVMISGDEYHYGPLYLFDESLFLDHIHHDIILYLDGTVPMGQHEHGDSKDIGTKSSHNDMSMMDSLHVGLELLLRNPQSLVGYHSMGYKVQQDGWNASTLETDTNTTTSANFIPFCKGGVVLDHEKQPIHERRQLFVQQKQQQQQQQQTRNEIGDPNVDFLHLSGTFLHRNLLCFLSHDTFQPFREKIQSIHRQYNTFHQDNSTIVDYKAWMEINSLFLSTAIPQLGGKLPLLYPLVQASWKGQDRDEMYTNQRRKLRRVAIAQDGDGEMEEEMIVRRRPRHYRHETSRYHLKDSSDNTPYGYESINRTGSALLLFDTDIQEHRKLSSSTYHNHTNNNDEARLSTTTNHQSIENHHQQQEQEQQQQSPIPSPTTMAISTTARTTKSRLSSETIASILNYFGTYPMGILCWCEKSNERNSTVLGNQTSCRKQCHPDYSSITSRDLPWHNIPMSIECS